MGVTQSVQSHYAKPGAGFALRLRSCGGSPHQDCDCLMAQTPQAQTGAPDRGPHRSPREKPVKAVCGSQNSYIILVEPDLHPEPLSFRRLS